MTGTVRRTFEVRDSGGTLIAWGDSEGIHYAPGLDAGLTVGALHAWGEELLAALPPEDCASSCIGLLIQAPLVIRRNGQSLLD